MSTTVQTPESPNVRTCATGAAVGLGACDRERGLKSQFGHPRGRLGRFIGRLMAVKNAAMNDVMVDLLDVWPGDRVLEIGFAHGRTIERLARRATQGHVAGVDISETMLGQATRRNRAFIDAGRVELHRASVAALPFAAGAFTKACAANNFQFWPDQLANLREVRRVLAGGGVLAIALRMAHDSPRRFAAPGFTPAEVQQVVRLVETAGFRNVGTEWRNAGGRGLSCVLATR